MVISKSHNIIPNCENVSFGSIIVSTVTSVLCLFFARLLLFAYLLLFTELLLNPTFLLILYSFCFIAWKQNSICHAHCTPHSKHSKLKHSKLKSKGDEGTDLSKYSVSMSRSMAASFFVMLSHSSYMLFAETYLSFSESVINKSAQHHSHSSSSDAIFCKALSLIFVMPKLLSSSKIEAKHCCCRVSSKGVRLPVSGWADAAAVVSSKGVGRRVRGIGMRSPKAGGQYLQSGRLCPRALFVAMVWTRIENRGLLFFRRPKCP